MSKTKQSFSYTGSSEYTIDTVVLSGSAIALFDTLTGVGGSVFASAELFARYYSLQVVSALFVSAS